MRAKQAATNEIKIDRSQARGDRTSQGESKAPHLSTWAALIQRVYETDPLTCPRCGSKMRIISFIETHQRDVIEKILRGHQSGAKFDGLWEGPLRTLANPRPVVICPDSGSRRIDREFQFPDSIPGKRVTRASGSFKAFMNQANLAILFCGMSGFPGGGCSHTIEMERERLHGPGHD